MYYISTTSFTRLWTFKSSVQNIYFPMQLSLTQTHHITQTKLRIFKMSILDDRLLLTGASIEANKEDAYQKTKKLMDKLAYIRENLIEYFDHIFHQYQIYSLENYFEDDGLQEINRSTYQTKPYKSDPSSFRNPTQLIKVSHFHQIMPRPWHIVTSSDLYDITEYNIQTITQ